MYAKKSSATVVLLLALVACQAQQLPTSTPNAAPALGVGIPLRIMPLGDSITEGLCDTPSNCRMPSFSFPTYGGGLAACDWAMNYVNPSAVGYREFLLDRLTAEGYDVTYVGSVSVIEGLAHEGHSGWTTGDLDYCIQNADWLEGVEPDIILLHTGTNDAGRAMTPEQMVVDLTNLLEHIYDRIPSTTEVVVAQIIPTRTGLHPYFKSSDVLMNDIIAPYNAQIPTVVDRFREQGNHVSYVDMGSVIESDSDFDTYGDHPNVASYERMADVWLHKILELLGREP